MISDRMPADLRVALITGTETFGELSAADQHYYKNGGMRGGSLPHDPAESQLSTGEVAYGVDPSTVDYQAELYHDAIALGDIANAVGHNADQG